MADTPKGIDRIATTVRNQYALLLLLDGLPYVELTAKKHADFLTDLAAWKRNTYPSLARSSVQFFLLEPSGVIKQLTFKEIIK